MLNEVVKMSVVKEHASMNNQLVESQLNLFQKHLLRLRSSIHEKQRNWSVKMKKVRPLLSFTVVFASNLDFHSHFTLCMLHF